MGSKEGGGVVFFCCFFCFVFCFFFGGYQGGCERERRIEVIVNKKKSGEGGQVRVDMNELFKFL